MPCKKSTQLLSPSCASALPTRPSLPPLQLLFPPPSPPPRLPPVALPPLPVLSLALCSSLPSLASPIPPYYSSISSPSYHYPSIPSCFSLLLLLALLNSPRNSPLSPPHLHSLRLRFPTFTPLSSPHSPCSLPLPPPSPPPPPLASSPPRPPRPAPLYPLSPLLAPSSPPSLSSPCPFAPSRAPPIPPPLCPHPPPLLLPPPLLHAPLFLPPPSLLPVSSLSSFPLPPYLLSLLCHSLPRVLLFPPLLLPLSLLVRPRWRPAR